MSVVKKLPLIVLAIVVMLSGTGFSGVSSGLSSDLSQRPCGTPVYNQSGFPIVLVRRTVQDTSVTVQIITFLPKQKVDILVGAYGTKGVNGVNLGSFTSSKAGVLDVNLTIPAQFKGAERLDLRAQSIISSLRGRNILLSSFASFYNLTSGSGGYRDNLLIQIIQVVRNRSVTIQVRNLMPNQRFNVLMWSSTGNGKMYQVGVLDTGKGGSLTLTYPIPASLSGERTILVGLQNKTQGCLTYTKFDNRTTR